MSNGQPSIRDQGKEHFSAEPATLLQHRRISSEASLNFSVAKVISIFTVVTGHWFTGTVLWIPVTFGLFIFAFSSAYFTAAAYRTEIDRKRFWKNKLERLGLRFWVILSFLSLVLLITGEPVIHWHSLIHFLGLSGALNWFGITNMSALGAGLWFFTLLLFFYVSYPFIAKLCARRPVAIGVAIVAAILALILEMSVNVGHELWLTALGFVLGVAYGLHEPKVRAEYALIVAGLSCSALLLMNLLGGSKHFNPLLIFAASVSITIWISKAKLPANLLARKVAKLETYLLEIFLIHTYFFMHVTGQPLLDFVASVVLIVVVAIALNHLVERVSLIVFRRPGTT
jgi:hypothetical protein